MGAALGFVTIIAGSLAAVSAFLWIVGRSIDGPKPKHILGKRDEELYHRAAKVMARMVHLQDLPSEEDGIDILSPLSQKQVTQWLTDYRKEQNKK